jgi:hypothetical protein
MKLIPLPLETQAATGANYELQYSHEDLTETAAATAQTIEAFAVKAKMSVKVIENVVDVPFQDASDAAFNTTTLIVGDGGDDDRLLASQELNVNGTEVLLKKGTGTDHVFTADDTIDLKFGSMTGKSLVNIDTGRGRLLLNIQDRRAVAPAS